MIYVSIIVQQQIKLTPTIITIIITTREFSPILICTDPMYHFMIVAIKKANRFAKFV